MEEIVLTSSEIAYIIHILSKYAIYNEDIDKVIHILIFHLPLEKDE